MLDPEPPPDPADDGADVPVEIDDEPIIGADYDYADRGGDYDYLDGAPPPD